MDVTLERAVIFLQLEGVLQWFRDGVIAFTISRVKVEGREQREARSLLRPILLEVTGGNRMAQIQTISIDHSRNVMVMKTTTSHGLARILSRSVYITP